jgi:hypothetical protein
MAGIGAAGMTATSPSLRSTDQFGSNTETFNGLDPGLWFDGELDVDGPGAVRTMGDT